jgi:hypothetical protein
MFNPDMATALAYMPSFEMAARALKVELISAPVHSDVEIETAIVALGREPRAGLVVMSDPFMAVHRAPIILAAARKTTFRCVQVRSLTEYPSNINLLWSESWLPWAPQMAPG